MLESAGLKVYTHRQVPCNDGGISLGQVVIANFSEESKYMTKKEFGPQPWLFPNPTVLVGTIFDGKPNFAPFAWCGITGGEPPTISVGIRHQRHTLKGILPEQDIFG